MIEDVRWVWFDLGGTLVCEDACVTARCRSLVAHLRRQGVHTRLAELRRLLEEAAASFHPRPVVGALEALGLGHALQEELLATARWRRELERPYEGAVACLEELAVRFRLGVVANQGPGARDRLARYGFLPFLEAALLSDELGIIKPHPKMFELLAERSGVEPYQIVVVGDRLDNDIGPAKAYGVKTIRVLQGLHRRQQPRVPEEVPDVVVGTVAAVAGVLSSPSGVERPPG